MSQGWESKSAESSQAEIESPQAEVESPTAEAEPMRAEAEPIRAAAELPSAEAESITASPPAAYTPSPKPVQTSAQRAEIKGNLAADADRKRRRQGLELQRERVLSERTSSPHRRSALELALATIEVELEQLGWSIKI